MARISVNLILNAAILLSLLQLGAECMRHNAQVDVKEFAPEIIDQIDKLVRDEYMSAYRIPGLGLAIVQFNAEGEQTLYAQGYGYQNISTNSTVNSESLFVLGSVSKSFTSTVVVRTIHKLFPELGGSVLDVPIKSLLPKDQELILRDRYRTETATFRELLSHQLCTNPDAWAGIVGAVTTTAEGVYRERYADQISKVRACRVGYNHNVIALAGYYAGVIANTTFEALLDEFLTDIGMVNSTFVKHTGDFPENLALPYFLQQDNYTVHNTELLRKVAPAPGTGGVMSNARDMSKYLQYHLNNGKVDGVQIDPEDVARWIVEPAVILGNPGFKNSPTDFVSGIYAYGLTFNLGIVDGWQFTNHPGYVLTYASQISMAPALKLAVYSSSSGPGSSVFGSQNELHLKIAQIITGLGTTFKTSGNFENPTMGLDFGVNVEAVSSNYKYTPRSIVPPRAPEDLVGIYGNGHTGEFTISYRNGTDNTTTGLYCNYGLFGTGPLIESLETPNVYQLQLDSDLVYEYNADGVTNFPIVFDFNTNNTVVLSGIGGTRVFEKDLTLDKLPAIPWSEEC